MHYKQQDGRDSRHRRRQKSNSDQDDNNNNTVAIITINENLLETMLARLNNSNLLSKNEQIDDRIRPHAFDVRRFYR